ncbi:MAG: hypothetical protein Q9M94_00755 [Candidatus Gracilibacteria bacterium]|nr:hypothetical protein [Candidatus Gracilibacteria bacterium]MDQ7022333.1 hypothetical protein [Candidatus Gracilibacteria bacterium]
MAKTYIDGTSCKAISGQFGEFFNVSINVEKLQQYANEKGYVNMVMSKRREVGQYGDTHYFTLNEYNPEANQNSTPTNNAPQNNSSDEISVEDVPF